MKFWAFYGMVVAAIISADMALNIWCGISGVDLKPRLPLEYVISREIFHTPTQ